MAGLPIARVSLAKAVDYVSAASVKGGDGLAIHFLTAHTIAVAETNALIRQILSSGDLLLPDSRWLEILSGIREKKLSQVRGPDFFRRVLSDQTAGVPSHFFVGPSQEVNDDLRETLRNQFPSVSVAGFFVAPHRPLNGAELRELSDAINAAGKPLVWLGVGTPAQNVLAHSLAKESGRVVVGVGAAFEFLSGIKPEAPTWVSRWGVEWLFRLVSEPKRLWRRYLFGNAVFLFAIVRNRLRTHKPQS